MSVVDLEAQSPEFVSISAIFLNFPPHKNPKSKTQAGIRPHSFTFLTSHHETKVIRPQSTRLVGRPSSSYADVDLLSLDSLLFVCSAVLLTRVVLFFGIILHSKFLRLFSSLIHNKFIKALIF